jgi:hypothetical protein
MNKYAKSILAFVSLVVTNEAAVLAQTGNAAPQGLHGWVVAIVTTAVGTAAVYFKANGVSKPTPAPAPVPVTPPVV